MIKVFAIVSLITIVFILPFIAYLSNKTFTTTDQSICTRLQCQSADQSICTRPQCQSAASFLQNTLNLSANPCDDFYSYACGGWMSNNIPRNMRYWTPLIKQAEQNFRSLLETDFDAQKHPPCVQQALNYYKACNNIEWRNNNSHILLRDMLEDIRWPLIDPNWNSSGDTYKWDEVYVEIKKKIGFDLPIMDLKVNHYSSKYYAKFTISPQRFLIRLDFFEKPDSKSNSLRISAHKKYIKEVLNLLSETNQNKSLDIDDQIDSIVDFDIKLYKLSAKWGTSLDNITIKEFMNKFTGIPLLKILQKITGDVFNESNKFTENDTIDVNNVSYFEQLSHFLSSTDNRTLANYIGWHFASNLLQLTNEELFKITKNYQQAIRPNKQQLESLTLSDFCIPETVEYFGFIFERLFADRYFTTEIKNDILKMGELLKQTFRSTIADNDWITEYSKQKLLEKLQSIEYEMVYVSFSSILNDTWLENYYSQLGYINDWNYFDATLKYRIWMRPKSFLKLIKRGDDFFDKLTLDIEWEELQEDIAYYDSYSNRIAIPVIVLQSPLYTYGLPAAMNFGGIGSAISHELNQAFDYQNSYPRHKFGHQINWRDKAVREMFHSNFYNESSEWNKDSNEIDWRDYQTKQIYANKMMCFVKQYNSYYDSESQLTVNGIRTLNENFADNEGVRLAFKTYKNSKSIEESLRVNNEIFSSDQLFFLSFASYSCANIKRDAFNNYIAGPELAKYRVLGSLNNLVEFSDAFKCKRAANMNVENKCSLW